MTLEKEEAQRIIWDDHDDWEEVDGTRVAEKNGRWMLCCDAVFLHKPTGDHYMFLWDAGATEQQYVEPYEYETDDIKPTKVHLVETVVKKWMAVK